jgi:toxin FitB
VNYLIDTNVISEFTRNRPEPRVIKFFETTNLGRLYIPDVVLAEVRFGVESVPDASRREAYQSALDIHIRPLFAGRILSADEDTWLVWKRMEAEGRRRRITYPQPDLLIAALAAQHRLVVVTRDMEPFHATGVKVFNPWNK